MSERKDPYHAFRFVVEVEQSSAGGFAHVSGLERSTTADEYREGGVNDFVHRLAGVTKYPNLVLKRGLADRTELWDWHQQVIDGTVQRRTVAVVLQDAQHAERRRWVFDGAYPIKWNGSDLDAAAHAVAVESLEFAHHGLRRQA
jgi:phage tail-like protein